MTAVTQLSHHFQHMAGFCTSRGHTPYCFACGTQLRHQCVNCQQPITSLKHRFCPYCGTAYKAAEPTAGQAHQNEND